MSTYPFILNQGTVNASGKPALVIKGSPIDLPKPSAVMHAVVNGTGAVGATVQVVGTNDQGASFVNLGSIVLSGTTQATGFLGITNPWDSYGAYVSAISGTSASVTATMSM